jgi:hypothetical protein
VCAGREELRRARLAARCRRVRSRRLLDRTHAGGRGSSNPSPAATGGVDAAEDLGAPSGAIDEIAGAWGGKPDTIMLLDLLPDDRSRVRFPKIRWAKRGTRTNILLAFDADTETFSYLCDEGDAERDYRAEMVELLGDGKWRTIKELAAKTENGGIGAGEQTIKPILEQHPDVFQSCTEAEAVALGRRSNAVLWQVVEEAS